MQTIVDKWSIWECVCVCVSVFYPCRVPQPVQQQQENDTLHTQQTENIKTSLK